MRISSLARIGLGMAALGVWSAGCALIGGTFTAETTGGSASTGTTTHTGTGTTTGVGGSTSSGTTTTGTTTTTDTLTGSCMTDADCAGQSTSCLSIHCVGNKGPDGGVKDGACLAVASAPGAACNDSGGKLCDGSGNCVACLGVADCPATGTACITPTCSSGACGTQNAADSATCSDSGGKVCSSGACVACIADADCGTGNVCQSQKCVGQCSDGLKDGLETDKDCGGGSCPACAVGTACKVNNDCVSTANCSSNVCTQCVSNYGAACGSCGGTIKCDGTCSVTTPSNYGATCGSCGGTVRCDGSCSVATPANLGAYCTTTTHCPCGYYLDGEIACNGKCVPTDVCTCCGSLPC